MLVFRLVYKDIIALGESEVKSRDLLSFFGSRRVYKVKDYRLVFKGLIVQGSNGTLSLLEPGSTMRLVESQSYCRWHNGPLNSKDNLLERRYCLNPSKSSLGYCLKHLRSDRALYDKCVSGMGSEALNACKIIDEKYPDLEHVVYLTVLPTGKVKVGVTRKFRILERIAEQQHVIATQLVVTRSVVEARKIEMKLSSENGISDKGLRSLSRTKSISVEQAYNILESTINNIVRNMDIDIGNIDIENMDVFRIKPPGILSKAEELKSIDMVENKDLVLRDYWGGFLFFEDGNGRIIAIKTTKILHKKSIIML